MRNKCLVAWLSLGAVENCGFFQNFNDFDGILDKTPMHLADWPIDCPIRGVTVGTVETTRCEIIPFHMN